MKCNFLGLTAGIVAIAATAIVAVSSVNANTTESDLLTKNLEALTQNEESQCPGGKCKTLYADGTEKCNACCQSGDTARCGEYSCGCYH